MQATVIRLIHYCSRLDSWQVVAHVSIIPGVFNAWCLTDHCIIVGIHFIFFYYKYRSVVTKQSICHEGTANKENYTAHKTVQRWNAQFSKTQIETRCALALYSTTHRSPDLLLTVYIHMDLWLVNICLIPLTTEPVIYIYLYIYI